jgi:hypothetical protein
VGQPVSFSAILQNTLQGGVGAGIQTGLQEILPAGLANLAGELLGIGGWRSRLLPASFRGVPFFVLSHEMSFGRRGVVHEFPLRDVGATEDLGSAVRRYMVEGYLVGDNYDQVRDAFVAAIDTFGPATLVHPYLGTLTVQPLEGCSVREHRDQGRICTVRLVCVDAGNVATSRASTDTTAGVLGAVGGIQSALSSAFSSVVSFAGPGALLSSMTGGLQNLVGGALSGLSPSGLLGNITAGIPSLSGILQGLPSSVASGLTGNLSAILSNVPNAGATADAVSAAFSNISSAIVANPPTGADWSGGMAALANFQGSIAPIVANTTSALQQLTNATALTSLVQGNAVASMASIASQINFPSAAAAQAAGSQVLNAITTQIWGSP